MESVRVRLVFKHRHVLNESQTTEGLRRSWLLLKPEHETISDLSAYLLQNFDLHDSCPNGLILSMAGFVLPPFESTCILKDDDVVCVKRKGDTLFDNITEDDGEDLIGLEENVEKPPVLTGVKLLANEEFEKETGGYQSETEDDEYDGTLHVKSTPDKNRVSKKRKSSKKLQSSKRKKKKVATTGECSLVPEDDHNDVHAEEKGSHQHSSVLSKKSVKKAKSSNLPSEQDKSSAVRNDEISNDVTKSKPSAKRFCQLQDNGNGKGSVDASDMPNGTKKSPSRSARRKKAKRQWLREQVKVEKEKLHQREKLEKDDEQSPVRNGQKVSEEHQQPDECSSEEEDVDVVPIVIRPGHIRFEPLAKGDADQTVQQNHVPAETFQWNMITSKKKGQKWGIEKTSSSSWKRNAHMNWNEEHSKKLTAEKETPVKIPIDFDKLTPYTSLPKKGDVIAYRLIELSSSWTPELSSFRVGKILWHNPESNRIMLVTVPEYPIAFEKADEEPSAAQPDMSLYGEDGSLKTDYSSLVDVRTVAHGNMNSEKAVTGKVNDVPVGNPTAVSGFRASNDNEDTPGPSRENGQVNAWDEISQALNSKKAQLSQDDSWSAREENSVKKPWLRGSALGPTMAYLRAENGL